jgi:hypothetical protein
MATIPIIPNSTPGCSSKYFSLLPWQPLQYSQHQEEILLLVAWFQREKIYYYEFEAHLKRNVPCLYRLVRLISGSHYSHAIEHNREENQEVGFCLFLQKRVSTFLEKFPRNSSLLFLTKVRIYAHLFGMIFLCNRLSS